MNNNPIGLDNVEDTKRVSRDEQTAMSAPIKSPNKRKPFEMLKPQLYILQEKLLSPSTVLFNPVVRLLKIPFYREKKDNLH
jgi:hypothetical protein